ncbi:MAG TPA: pyridoxamine 5'-phosphate oxidase family protein [Dehalococcoidia bacterium]|nr:pyridoxamine 5'-phosphate oxidase family protein [Dehalococcoidia bacterium]
MRRKEKEIADPAEIEEIVKKAKICRIGLVDGEEPYIVPVCFGYEGNALYFHSAHEGRKMDLIRRNNRVCFEIDTDVEVIDAEKPCGWSTRYRSVIGVGWAHILEDEEDKIRGLAVLMRQFGEKKPDLEFEKAARAAVVRIDIENITGKKSGY